MVVKQKVFNVDFTADELRWIVDGLLHVHSSTKSQLDEEQSYLTANECVLPQDVYDKVSRYVQILTEKKTGCRTLLEQLTQLLD